MEKKQYIQPTIEMLPAEPDSPLLVASPEDEEISIPITPGTQQTIDEKSLVW